MKGGRLHYIDVKRINPLMKMWTGSEVACVIFSGIFVCESPSKPLPHPSPQQLPCQRLETEERERGREQIMLLSVGLNCWWTAWAVKGVDVIVVGHFLGRIRLYASKGSRGQRADTRTRKKKRKRMDSSQKIPLLSSSSSSSSFFYRLYIWHRYVD